MKKRIVLISFFVMSCKGNYKVVSYDSQNIPNPPKYDTAEAWAVLPEVYPEQIKFFTNNHEPKLADVFYIYPTLLTEKKNTQWNAAIDQKEVRQEVLNTPVKFQASAWIDAANLYVPYYRQAHYRAYLDPFQKEGKKAFRLAYEDVRRAFRYYLKHYNLGKPIILAGHSQGSHHLKEILKEFFDGKPLQKQLVAAYLIGIKLLPNDFNTLSPMYAPEEVGGYVTWNTYKKGHLPKTYTSWYKGGITINPITWDETNSVGAEKHLGILNGDLKIYPKSVAIERVDGMLWATVPKIPKRFWLSFIKNYHFADINLFWADIQQNAKLRVSKWQEQNLIQP